MSIKDIWEKVLPTEITFVFILYGLTTETNVSNSKWNQPEHKYLCVPAVRET